MSISVHRKMGQGQEIIKRDFLITNRETKTMDTR